MRFKIIICLSVLIGAMVFLFLVCRPATSAVGITFVGYTNRFVGYTNQGLSAVFQVTNRTPHSIHISNPRVQIRTATGWTNYSDPIEARIPTHGRDLGPFSSGIETVTSPPEKGRWRVGYVYWRPLVGLPPLRFQIELLMRQLGLPRERFVWSTEMGK